MERLLLKICFLGVLFFSFTTQGQQRLEKRGENEMKKYAYVDAIKIYERLAKKGYDSPLIYSNLGDAYYFNGKLKEANIWYAKLFDKAETSEVSLSSEYYYRYGQTLKGVEDYEKSDAILEKFNKIESADTRGVLFKNNKDYLAEIKANSGRYDIQYLDLNSSSSDYGSTIYNDKLVFASARDRASISKNIHDWTGEYFTNLYAASIDNDGSIKKIEAFGNEINSKFNESTPVFSKDGTTVYFTRNNFFKGKRGRNSKDITLIKIYQATLVNGKWTNIKELPFNSDDFSSAHPALTSDGKWMYFASDRDGGHGQSDIYKVEIHKSGDFGKPINLGASINTEGRETFPFITEDNELYFSTDGRPGLGGLDIYVTQVMPDGSFAEVQNIGAPINSPKDDFAFYLDSNSRKGFFSSNRVGEVDNIYSLVENLKLELTCEQSIQGIVYDKTNSLALSGAKVVLYDNKFNQLSEVLTDDQGRYSYLDLKCGDKYRINASLGEFNTAEVSLNLKNENGTAHVNFGLEKTRIEVQKGDDLFKVLNLEPIHFDFDKSNIRPDAALELAKIVEVLRENPNMKIDVRSHTDSRGNDAYNLKLSDRRAKSTIQWIVNQGIDNARVTGRGFGEVGLINRCANGVKCTEEEHQENRRSEFIVTDL